MKNKKLQIAHTHNHTSFHRKQCCCLLMCFTAYCHLFFSFSWVILLMSESIIVANVCWKLSVCQTSQSRMDKMYNKGQLTTNRHPPPYWDIKFCEYTDQTFPIKSQRYYIFLSSFLMKIISKEILNHFSYEFQCKIWTAAFVLVIITLWYPPPSNNFKLIAISKAYRKYAPCCHGYAAGNTFWCTQ